MIVPSKFHPLGLGFALVLAAFAPSFAPAQEKEEPPGQEKAQPPPAPEEDPSGTSIDINEDGTPRGTGKAALELLRAMEKRHGRFKTVEGSFLQLKVSKTFLEEIQSEGRFWFSKPARLRVDYAPPDEMINLIDADAIYVYTPSLEQVEVYKFQSNDERDQKLHTLVLGFGFKADRIVGEYACKSSDDDPELAKELPPPGPETTPQILLHLTPRPAIAETSPFTQLKLWVNKETLMPAKIWYEEYNHDETTMDIVELKIDPEIDPVQFDPTKVFPPGVEIIRQEAF